MRNLLTKPLKTFFACLLTLSLSFGATAGMLSNWTDLNPVTDLRSAVVELSNSTELGPFASRIAYLFRAALNASSPLVALTGTNVQQVATGSVVVPAYLTTQAAGTTLVTIAANNPAIPHAGYRDSAWHATDSEGTPLATAAVLASGLTKYTAGPAGNPSLGVLAEPSGTNLALQSSAFDNAAWTKYNLGVTANQATAPDGTASAYLITGVATTDLHFVYQTYTFSGAAHTYSVFLKHATEKYVSIRIYSGGSTKWVTFDLLAGTITNVPAGTTATIEAESEGFYRVSVTATPSAGSQNVLIGLADTANYNGAAFLSNTGEQFYAWGAQLETGSVATTYIPTTIAAVTRPPRYTTMAGAEIGSKLRFDLVSNEALSSAGRTTTLFDDLTRKVKYVAGMLVFRDESQVMGSELVTNGTFNSDITGWTNSSAGGSNISWNAAGMLDLNVSAGAEAANADQQITTVAGKLYKYSLTKVNATGALFFIGTTKGNNNLVSTVISSQTTHTGFFRATGTTTWVRFNSSAAGATATVDNISIQEVAELTHAATLNADTIYEIGIDMGTAASMHINGVEVATATFPAASQFSGTTFVGSKVVSGTASETLNGQISVIESSSSAGFDAGSLL